MQRSEFYWLLNDNICSEFFSLKIFNSCLRISLPYEFIFTSKFSFTDICNSVHPSMNSKCFGLKKDKSNLLWGIEKCSGVPTEDKRSASVFSLYGQISQGWMANFPAFIASKSFDLWNLDISQMKWHYLQHILMY